MIPSILIKYSGVINKILTLVIKKKTYQIWIIPYVKVTFFAAFFGLVLPVNYLLLARDQLLFACL